MEDNETIDLAIEKLNKLEHDMEQLSRNARSVDLLFAIKGISSTSRLMINGLFAMKKEKSSG